MRRVAAALLLSSLVHLSPPSALAAPGPGGEFGTDQTATGELLGGDTAEVVAREGRDLGPQDRARRGG